MSGVIRQSVEYLPEIAAGAGLLVGAGLEAVAQRNMSRNRESLANEWGEDVVGTPETKKRTKIIGRVVGPLAVLTSAVAAFNGAAWQPAEGAETAPPHVEVVIDHSGATGIGDRPIESINDIALELVDEDIDTSAVVASSGVERIMPLDEIIQNQPFGDARMDRAAATAIDRSTEIQREIIGSETERSIGIVAITNGNTLGDPQHVIERAEESNIPIFVVNVEGKDAPANVASELESIAEGTDGKYFEAEAANAEEIAQEVDDVLEDRLIDDDDEKNRWIGRVVAGALALTIPSVYRKRKNMTFYTKGSQLSS